MAVFKLGLSSGSLNDMPAPKQVVRDEKSYKREIKTTVGGDRNVTYIGRAKRNITMTFENLSAANYSTLIAYVDQPIEYWAELNDGGATKLVDTWVSVISDGGTEMIVPSSLERRYNIKIILIEL